MSKIFHPIDFHVKQFSDKRSCTALSLILRMYFHAFNFRTTQAVRAMLSHCIKRLLCFPLLLCLFAAEAPTHKSHYLQTNTIPMYDDDIFNQLGPATNDITPRELDYDLPVSHKFLSLSLSPQPHLLDVYIRKILTFETARPKSTPAH